MSGFPAPSFVLAQGASNGDPHRILMRRKPKLGGATTSIWATPSLSTSGRVDNTRFNGLLRLCEDTEQCRLQLGRQCDHKGPLNSIYRGGVTYPAKGTPTPHYCVLCWARGSTWCSTMVWPRDYTVTRARSYLGNSPVQ